MASDTVHHLRILATSDVHANLTGEDELRDLPTPRHGLLRAVNLIRQARQSARGGVLLLDNGDMLQGTPLADNAANWAAVDGSHPIVKVMTALGYDAMGPGNHDFDYGAAYLSAFAAAVPFPLVASSLAGARPPGIKPFVILNVRVSPTAPDLKVGIISVMPAQTGEWSGGALPTGLTFLSPAKAAETAARKVRAAGADLVIALVHGGAVVANPDPSDENCLPLVARIDGVDALVSGHTHQCLPGQDHAGIDGIDHVKGLVHGKPCVMPGFAAAYVGQIDLSIARIPGSATEPPGWKVTGSDATLLSVDGQDVDQHLLRRITVPRARTRHQLDAQLGQTDVHMHSYFATLQPSHALGLVAQSMLGALDTCALPDEIATLPRLAAISPHMCGGRAGPTRYVDVPPGPISERALHMLCPFADNVTALVVNGQTLKQWLNRSTTIFATSPETAGDASLIDYDAPAFNFDMFLGLRVRIALATDETAGEGGAPPVSHLQWQDTPLQDDARFLLAMSSFRARGGGGFPGTGRDAAALTLPVTMRESVVRLLAQGRWTGAAQMDWRLARGTGRTVFYDTSPRAEAHLDEISSFDPQPLGLTDRGFLRLRLTL